MDILDLKTDLEAAEDGTWFPFGEDCRIKIAAWGNKKHKKFLRKMYSKHGRKIEAGAVTDDQANELLRAQWIHIVKDWDGLEKGEQPFEYSQDNLLELSSDKRFDNFFKRIEGLAKEEENFRETNIQDMGEDSPIT